MHKFLYKLNQIVHSRTFWLVVITFLINSIPTIRELIPMQWLPVVDLTLAFLTTLTHVFPSANYNEPINFVAVDNPTIPKPPEISVENDAIITDTVID